MHAVTKSAHRCSREAIAEHIRNLLGQRADIDVSHALVFAVKGSELHRQVLWEASGVVCRLDKR